MLNSSGYFGSMNAYSFNNIREPLYAGTWYPGSEEELKSAVDNYLEQAVIPEMEGTVVGIVSPHAGFLYSGSVAGHAFKSVQGREIELVVIMGNAHREPFQGAAIDDVMAYRTPLGLVDLDQEVAKELHRRVPSIMISSAPHQKEHSLEIQIPFLQRALHPGFKILPILFGYQSDNSASEIVSAISQSLKNKSVLFVASTDLTHYPSYSDAMKIDVNTVELIASMDPAKLANFESVQMKKDTTNLHCVMCAGTATRSTMILSRTSGADYGVVLKYSNSGDVEAGERHQVVGYGAVAFVKEEIETSNGCGESELSVDEQVLCLGFSRHVLEEYVTSGKTPDLPAKHRLARARRGVFVTLHKDGDLRGCIGYIEPVATCLEAIRDNTISACSRDPRFSAVYPDELEVLDIEISVLSPAQTIDHWQDIELGKHGIILEKNRHRSVFLPQVAPEQGWDLETTLMYLALKAGLPADGWQDAVLKVFQAQVFNENDLGRQSYNG